MGTIQLINISTEELKAAIVEGVKIHLDELKDNYQPRNPKRLMTRQEVADFFSVDLSTIYHWCKAGKLNPLGKGSRVYFDRDEVENSLLPLREK